MQASDESVTTYPWRWASLLTSVGVISIIAAHRFGADRWSELASDVQHSLHGPGFALFAVVILWFLQRRHRRPINFLIAACAAMAVGFLSEAAQIPGPRDAQVQDLVVDALGIIGALGVVGFFDNDVRLHVSNAWRVRILLVCIPALAYACVPTMWFSYAWIQQLRAVPELLTFEYRWETAAYGQPEKRRPKLIAVPDSWPIAASTVAQASGAGPHDIFLSLNPPRNWSSYSRISFVAAAANEPFKLAVGIRDMRPDRKAPHNRYFGAFDIGMEPLRYTISFDEIRAAANARPFDMSHIEAVVFSAAKPGAGAELIIDDIRLE